MIIVMYFDERISWTHRFEDECCERMRSCGRSYIYPSWPARKVEPAFQAPPVATFKRIPINCCPWCGKVILVKWDDSVVAGKQCEHPEGSVHRLNEFKLLVCVQCWNAIEPKMVVDNYATPDTNA